MKITYKKIVLLTQIMPEVEQIEVPWRYRLRIIGLMKEIEKCAEYFDLMRKKVIVEYSDKKTGQIPSEKLSLADAEVNDMAQEEVEINFEPMEMEIEPAGHGKIGVMLRTAWMWAQEAT